MSNRPFATMEQYQGTWYVYVGGLLRMKEESYQVASNVVDAINHPERQEPSEAQEIADSILRDIERRG